MDDDHSWEKLASNGSTSTVNPLQKPCIELDDEYDEELISIPSARLELVSENAEDIQICRTCRTYSNISNPNVPTTVPSSNSPIHLTPTEGSRLSSVSSTNGTVSQQANLIWYDDYMMNDSDMDVPLLQVPSDGISCTPAGSEEDHCHVMRPRACNHRNARNQLITSSILCFTFMIAEIVGGHLSNSLAIMTDAAHMLSDLTSFLISLFALWVGSKAPSKTMPFGYYRAEIIGAVISVLLIWILTGVLVYLAACRVIDQSYIIHANFMIIVALVGIVFNVIMGTVLHSCCNCQAHHAGHNHSGHNHSGHSHRGNINVRAAFIHVVGDLVQSVGVLVAACIIKLKPEYHLADPICTFLFSGLVLLTTVSILRDSLHILMEGFPLEIDYANIKRDLETLSGVKGVHSLYVWSLTMGKHALIVHLALDDCVNNNQVVQQANRIIRHKYNINQSTIQTEPYDADVMSRCHQCLGP